jgi:queuine tRNA-ribosyltransferase
VDGALHTLSPESAMEIQWQLGADIAMAFDHVVPGQSSFEAAGDGMERTLRWLDRCKERHAELSAQPASGSLQTMWPILQGGVHDELRLRSLEGTLARGPWTGRLVACRSVSPSP